MIRSVMLMLVLAIAGALADPVRLTGRDLTIADLVRVARERATVEIAPDAMDRAATAYRVLLAAAAADMPVYGLNRGVGSMRQVRVLQGDVVNPEIQRISEAFNRQMLLSHSQSAGPEATESVVRATMLARLNTALYGGTALRPELLGMYVAFLNRGIHPVMRTRGSIGQGDIFITPAIGLAMMGLGEVRMGTERLPAAEALRRAGLQPLAPFGKDALGLLSNNAYAAGMAALALHDARHLLAHADVVTALALEALNGNVAPLLPASLAMRPYPQVAASAAGLRDLLSGSYLWQPHPNRFLQDPLSFRDTPHVHGAVRGQLDTLERHLLVQLNSSDDNPTVVIGIAPPADALAQERGYYVSGTVMGQEVRGAVFPTAHFEPIVWALDLQNAINAVSHLANHATQRGNRLSSGQFTPNVTLTPEEQGAGVASSWKTADSLFAELVGLTMPLSVRVLPSARDIEHVGTNAPLLARRLSEAVDLSYRILGIELLIAAQLVDVRLRSQPDLALGVGTRSLLTELRRSVPFLSPDRVPSDDIDAAYRVLRGARALQSDRPFDVH
jgi:histidine ammonia-lyase